MAGPPAAATTAWPGAVSTWPPSWPSCPILRADDVVGLLARVRDQLPPGVTPSLLLADHQETSLVEVGSGDMAVGEPVAVAGSAPGRAFIAQQMVLAADELTVWIPVTNRWRRLGVLVLGSAQPVPATIRRDGPPLGTLLGCIVDGASRCTDAFHRARRREHFSLTAEMQWELLPPPTVSAPGICLAGRLEPAYQVGGDAFDYAINADTAELAIFDPLGHDLRSAMLAALAVGVYRHARRGGAAPSEIGRRIDEVIREQFGVDSAFVTGKVYRLDTGSGS